MPSTTSPVLFPALRLSPAVLEVEFHFSCFFAASFTQPPCMLGKSVAFQVDLCSENYKLLLLTLWLLAEMVVPGKVGPQVGVVGIEGLEAVSIAEVTEVVVFPQVLEQLLVVEESSVAILAQRVAFMAGVALIAFPPMSH